MRGAGENIDDGMGFYSTGRAEGARDYMIGMQGATKRYKEFEKGSHVGAKEVCFFSCYLRESSLKDTVTSQKGSGIGNGFSMKGLDGNPIIVGGYNTVRQIRSNTMKKPTRWRGDYIVGRVVRLESSDKILEANQEKVIMDRKPFSFLMQVIDRSHFNAAGGYVEGRVLDRLEFLNKGW